MSLDTGWCGGYGPSAWEFQMGTRPAPGLHGPPVMEESSRVVARDIHPWIDLRRVDARNSRDWRRG